MTGYSCDFATAKQYLVEALELERALDEPNEVNVSKRLSELARLSFDMGEFQASVDYFAEAVEQLEGLSIESLDPIGFADFLQTYAAALEETGAAELAGCGQGSSIGVAARRTATRKRNSFPVEYRDVCKE